jgi:hypothetical protein
VIDMVKLFHRKPRLSLWAASAAQKGGQTGLSFWVFCLLISWDAMCSIQPWKQLDIQNPPMFMTVIIF